MVDQAPPAIQISTVPFVSAAAPSTTLAGTAVDSSEILSAKLKLERADWNGTKTYWNGTAWEAAAETVVLDIPPGKKSVSWEYSGLEAKDIISGSRYVVTIYATDKFGHSGSAVREFYYNACTSSVPYAATYNGEDIFEVGTALFRKMTTDPVYMGHMGLYIVSDSQYVANNGVSTTTFVSRLAANNGRLLPLLKTNAAHFIVNAVPEGVEYTSAVGFMDAPYWGAREWAGLTHLRRDKIAWFASLQLGKPYADRGAKQMFFPIGPDWAGETEPQHFRCDGLVVYAYKQTGLFDAVAGYTDPKSNFPVDLAHRWEAVHSSVPVISNLRVAQAGDKFNISVLAEDSESGIDKVDYFLRTHPTVGRTEFLGTVDTDNLGAVDYTLQNTCNPGPNLYARAVDRAGNWQLSDPNLSPSRSAGPKAYNLPGNDSPPDPFERVNFNPPVSQAHWGFHDDTTPKEKLFALFAVDTPFESWTNDNINVVQGGDSGGSFWVDSGTHTLYLAVLDEYGNATFQREPFVVPNFYAMFNGGPARPAGEDIALSFGNETTPGEQFAAMLPMTWAPPAGYQTSPVSRAYDIQTTAQYAGAVGVQVKLAAAGLSTEEKRRLHLLHLNNGAWEDVTAGVDTANDIIFGYPNALSPFVIYSSPESVPERSFPDRWAPHTRKAVSGGYFLGPNGEEYVSTTSILGLAGIDDHAAGVETYYKLEISPELETAGLTKENKASFSVFSTGITAAEGRHRVGYASVDAAENYESLSTAAFLSDGTPPVAELFAGTVPVADGGTAYLVEGDSLTLVAVDHESNGVASGVAARYALVDVSPEECDSDTPPAACDTAEYSGPFTLPVGTHTVYYATMDNVGNQGEVKTAGINVWPARQISATAKTSSSITWGWVGVAGAEAYQVFSASGGAISGELPPGTTWFAQNGLTPDTPYGAYLFLSLPGQTFSTAVSTGVTLAGLPAASEVFTMGQNASIVIGQPNYVSTAGGLAPNRLATPAALHFDVDGNLWIADRANNRVLRFAPPFSSGMSASLVIGQSNLYSNEDISPTASRFMYPSGLATDGEGNLWVSDNMGRILRFPKPFLTGMSANLVIGAGNFTTMGGGCAQNRLAYNSWGKMSFDAAGALWISDWSNNRVLRFSPPLVTGMGADMVLGQVGFSSCGYGAPSPSTLYGPAGVKISAGGEVWVSDYWNDRVLKYSPPFYSGMPAQTVLGQDGFLTNNTILGRTQPSAASLSGPMGLEFDAAENLYVADSKNNRVLKFRSPFSNGMPASLVLGQNDFVSSFNMNLQATFNFPSDADASGFVVTDSAGRLWVSDQNNNRILMFEPVHTGIFTEVGSSSFTVNWLRGANPDGTLYWVEISKNKDFSSGVIPSGYVTGGSFTFFGVEDSSRYYARVKARNRDGEETSFAGLNSVFTLPAPVADMRGIALSPSSIQWVWGGAKPGLKFQIYDQTGTAVSGVLGEGTTTYVQTGLTPNTSYSCFVRTMSSLGNLDSAISVAVTKAQTPAVPEPFLNGQEAEVVLGQPDFYSAARGLAANKMSSPDGAAISPDGRLFVADLGNCRVLGFSPPFSTSKAAEIVIGQQDFDSNSCQVSADTFDHPQKLKFDAAGNLWVMDQANRLLRFPAPYAGVSADLVIGQDNFTSNLAGTASNRLNGPVDFAFDAVGALWVADGYNYRAVRFSPPFHTGKAADIVLGQSDFVTKKYQSATSADTFAPKGISSDNLGNILISESAPGRVLVFNPPFYTKMPAAAVLGQPDMATPPTRTNTCATTAAEFCSPQKIAVANSGALYVSDTGNRRVLKFAPPLNSGSAASLVLGQPDFNAANAAVSPAGVYSPSSMEELVVGGKRMLFVADIGYNRVLGFKERRSAFSWVGLSSMSVVWTGNLNPSGTEYRVEVSTSELFAPLTADSGWMTGTTEVFSGLAEAATYYARVKARNATGLETENLSLGYAVTGKNEVIIVASTDMVNGVPELSLAARKEMFIAHIPAESSGAVVVMGSAAVAGLLPISNLYLIGPDGSYDPPAVLTFSFSTATFEGSGLTIDDLAVYEYFAGRGWVELENQSLDRDNFRITVPVTQIASLFAIFGVVKDRAAPVTTLEILGPDYFGEGRRFVAAKSSVAFSAQDPVVFGTFTGVGYTEFRIGSGTETVFEKYSAPFRLEEGERMIGFRSADNAGNVEAEKVSMLYVDGTAPVSTAALNSTQGFNGWHVSTVVVNISAADSLSGVGTVYYALNGDGFETSPGTFSILSQGIATVRYYAEDNTGNKEREGLFYVKIDTVAPIVHYSLSPSQNTAGWNSSPVMVVFNGTDAVSGIDYCSSTITVSAEGAGIAVSGYCQDFAGWASTAAFTVNIDTTPPGIAYTTEPAPNAAGWNNSDVNIEFACSDGLSGVKSCPADIVMTSEGMEISTSVAAVDYADNSVATLVSGLKIDKASPVSTATLSGVQGGGWYSSNVEIAIAAEDPLSGVKRVFYSLDTAAEREYMVPVAVSSEGGHSLKYYAEDAAGNKETARELAFAIDKTAPEISHLLEPLANEAGWNRGSVRVVFAGTDTLSGIAGCSSAVIDAEGREQRISGSCRDMAGNISYSTATVNIDMEPPAVSYVAEPAPNAAGWNNSDVAIKFACVDALSGIKSCPADMLLSGEGMGISTSVFALDYADNLRPAFVTGIKIDKTVPAVVIASPTAGDSYVAGKGTINIWFSVVDNLDQAPSVSALLVQVLDKGTPRGERPSSVNAASGQALNPMALDDGLWRLEVVAVDAADNSTRTVTGIFEVVHDTIAPQTTLNIGEPKFDGEAIFINSATPLMLSATDDMLVAGDRQGVGVDFSYASIDGNVAAVVAGPFNILGEGLHTLAYYSVDKAGNVEPVKAAAFSVDNSAPETEHTITGPVFQGVQLYTSTSAMIALSAVEPPSSGAASGLAAIFVADSTDAYVAYSGVFTAAEGAHIYGYYAKDRLGNASQVKTLALVADGTPPATELGFSLAPSTETANRLTISSDTYVWLAGTDAHSGIAAITYSIDGSTPAVFASSFTLTPGPHNVVWWSVDNVGNAESARMAAIQVRGQTGLAEVTLSFSPQIVNLKSEGRYVEARLTVSSAAGAGFDEETIRITRINDVALAEPLYALMERGQGKKDRLRERKHSVAVKFDRQALLAVLPVNAVSVVTVEGSFDDDTAFIAEDNLRVMNPERMGKGKGGKLAHKSRACVEIGGKALKNDEEISLASVFERDSERRERNAKAAAKALTRRGEPFEFGPEGTVFAEPVEISLPYESFDAQKEKLQVAYWNPSSKDWEPLASTIDPAEKVVKAKVGHFSLYQVLVSTIAEAKLVRPAGEQPLVSVQDAGPSTAFTLGEVYVYPNPAKGGDAPIFHIECGLADSVDIKVYTVSGREAHEATLTAMPATIDQRYAYEYVWRGHIPSGVYLYFIEARKGGQKIKKTGKFAVVR
ncbi:MAG: hypothetical protein A2049_09515 [Elusimicrobia bacterium GWA2_62_23]|nr:MAG: hypothetical protein A2049_09515 [Elusimicrobia bacterium GWA2_62_23]